MNDPHVEELRYHVKTTDDLVFEDPPPIKDETDAFRMTLTESVATFWMKEHHRSEEAAKMVAEEYLRAWEIDLALQRNRTSLHFIFDRAKVIDRNPPPGTPVTVELEGLIAGVSNLSAEATVIKREYPPPPKNFVADTDTRAMWAQYERYIQGHDRLLPMAYSCLTRLEFRAMSHPAKGNKRERAADMYRIHVDVLKKLGELSTNLGDEVEARKLTPQSELRPPTEKEVTWIESALKLIIRRTGEYAADPHKAWRQAKMTHLPTL